MTGVVEEALSRRRRPLKSTQQQQPIESLSIVSGGGGCTLPIADYYSKKRRKKRKSRRNKRHDDDDDDDAPFHVLFVQTGAMLGILFWVNWRIYRFFVPARTTEPVGSSPLNGDNAGANIQRGGEVYNNDGELIDQEQQYIPPPLPTFNLSFHANYDAFSLAKLLRTSDQEEEEQQQKKESNDLVQFWNEAYNLHSEFAEYYGGENTARALVDLGLSTFAGGADVDHNKNKNKTSIHENAQSSTKSSLQFPSDLQHMACRILSARTSQRPFRFTFGGYSVTAGRGNYFHQSFPFVLETKLQSIFSHVGVPLQVRNAAIGGCPAFPYGWCMSNFWGTDTDVVSWDFAMNEAGGDPLGMEAYIRHVLQLPRRPKLIVKDTYMATQRRDLLQYYYQSGALKDPVVVHTDLATEHFLLRDDRDLPVGFREWRKVSVFWFSNQLRVVFFLALTRILMYRCIWMILDGMDGINHSLERRPVLPGKPFTIQL